MVIQYVGLSYFCIVFACTLANRWVTSVLTQYNYSISDCYLCDIGRQVATEQEGCFRVYLYPADRSSQICLGWINYIM